jgi:hypothetical protein
MGDNQTRVVAALTLSPTPGETIGGGLGGDMGQIGHSFLE